MHGSPRVTIVTASFNQGRYIAATVESVLAQGYPDVEHIVVDGGSTDETLEVLGRYPHLKVISEPDRGHADAINKGFRLATGGIWGFLNSDDTLVPGALHRVAREIDPARGRHIVMGRCRFIDERGRYVGIEHPSRFESHRRVLEVWKGHTIPQPAVFWTPEVWKSCGPMDDRLKSAWIDYDLFCRFSRKYELHFVDQVLAAYRLHPDSKTGRWTEADRLEESIRLGRRYWGSPLRAMYWRLALSLAAYRFDRVGRARRWLRQAREHWLHRQAVRAVPEAVAGAALAPEVAFYAAIYPPLKQRAAGAVKRALNRLGRMGGTLPQTAVYLDRTDAWDDGWAGPRLIVSREIGSGAAVMSIRGWVDLTYLTKPFVLTVRLDGQGIAEHRVERSGEFLVQIPLAGAVPAGTHMVEVEASVWFVPHRFTRNGDFRPLAWRVDGVDVGDAAASS